MTSVQQFLRRAGFSVVEHPQQQPLRGRRGHRRAGPDRVRDHARRVRRRGHHAARAGVRRLGPLGAVERRPGRHRPRPERRADRPDQQPGQRPEAEPRRPRCRLPRRSAVLAVVRREDRRHPERTGLRHQHEADRAVRLHPRPGPRSLRPRRRRGGRQRTDRRLRRRDRQPDAAAGRRDVQQQAQPRGPLDQRDRRAGRLQAPGHQAAGPGRLLRRGDPRRRGHPHDRPGREAALRRLVERPPGLRREHQPHRRQAPVEHHLDQLRLRR